MTMHHLITDGWSFGVAASELAALYEANRHGRPSPLADPPIQYADFARWQRDQLQNGAWAPQIESPETPTRRRALSGAADGSPSSADPQLPAVPAFTWCSRQSCPQRSGRSAAARG